MRNLQNTDCPNCWGYQTYENNNLEQEFYTNNE
jgi:hypothetical protein